MLFADGSRIDLTLMRLSYIEQYAKEDSLTAILLDKDERISVMPRPLDLDYGVKKPSASFYEGCCNEFWWITTYVAKGVARGEIVYA